VSEELPAAGGSADPADKAQSDTATDAASGIPPGVTAPLAQAVQGPGADGQVTAAAGTDPAGKAPAGAAAGPAGTARRRWLTGSEIIQAITHGSSAVITTLAIFLALLAGGLLIVFSDPTVLHDWSQFFSAPGTALSQTWTTISAAYSAMFEGAIFSPGTISAAFHGGSIAAIFYPLSLTAFQATPIILTGLSVALAFRAGLFNIGAAGQWVGGAIVATYLGFGVSLPIVIHVTVCVIGAFVGGAVIGWIVGLLKARTGAHEVIVTIMLNYVMYNLLSYLLSTPRGLQLPHQSNLVAPNIANNAYLPHVGGPPPEVGVGFLIALAAAIAVGWLLSRSTVGFRVRTVGANPSAARSAGMSVERVWVLVMLLAGGLAGLSASTIIQGTTQPLTFNSFGTYGFDGITVALLGRARPLGVVLAGLLFGALYAGGTAMAAATSVPSDVVEVIQGLIVLFVAAPPLIRATFRLRRAADTGMEAVAKGWNG
jgi:general nucleoside transport system permease protein